MISVGPSDDVHHGRRVDLGRAHETRESQRGNTGSMFNFFRSKKKSSERTKYRVNVHELHHDANNPCDKDNPKHDDESHMPPKPTREVPLYAWTECTFGDDPDVLKNHAWSDRDFGDEGEAPDKNRDPDKSGHKNRGPLHMYTTNDHDVYERRRRGYSDS